MRLLCVTLGLTSEARSTFEEAARRRALRVPTATMFATCQATGESFIQARALNTAGWIHAELHDHAGSLDLNGQSLALAAAIETADTEITSNARLNLGDSLVALGRFADADEQYQAVEHVVRKPRPQAGCCGATHSTCSTVSGSCVSPVAMSTQHARMPTNA